MSDLSQLDAYLSSDDSPDECMQLSDLDGFLTGVICSPELIAPSEWLPVALRTDEINIRPKMLGLIMQRYNEIVAALNNQPPFLEPVFWQAKEGHVIAMDWCEGFMDAVVLRKPEWDAFIATKQGRKWMQPIVSHLFDQAGVSLSGVSERELDAHLDLAAENIPKIVPLIFTYWQARPPISSLR